MLGALLALTSAATFAFNNAAYRRGALTGTAEQAMAISLPVGTIVFAIAIQLTGGWAAVAGLSRNSVFMFCLAGILHFTFGRYCNFRATKAMGANLVAPVQQFSLVVTIILAVGVLGEALTPMKVLGILLVILAPTVSLRSTRNASDAPAGFVPQYAEGYTFALLSAVGYGVSPVLVSAGLQNGGVATGLAGGLIAYAAACIVLAAMLFATGQARHVALVSRNSRNWFLISSVLVGLSQMFAYMALTLAPVTIVVPIQRLSLVFRIFANSILNRDYEVRGGRIWTATAIALIGSLILSANMEPVLETMPLPDCFREALRWTFP